MVFAFGFLLLKRRTSNKKQKGDYSAVLGFVLEAAGYTLVFSIRRDSFTDIIPMNPLVEYLFFVLVVSLAFTSVWLSLSAVKTLDKQWDLRAQIIEGHKLITTGPYNIVRHPIYSGMFGLLIITGYSITKLWAFMIAIALYFLGTVLRTKVEEKLLIQHFGDEYIKYRERVPALIPFIF